MSMESIAFGLVGVIIIYAIVSAVGAWMDGTDELSAPNTRHYYGDFGRWVAEYVPELDAKLGPMTRLQVLAELNRLTGLNIGSHESISKTMPLFLAALKQLREQGKI